MPITSMIIICEMKTTNPIRSYICDVVDENNKMFSLNMYIVIKKKTLDERRVFEILFYSSRSSSTAIDCLKAIEIERGLKVIY